MTGPSPAALSTLAHRRIFFAHQSVGANILDGVRAHLETAGVTWPIMEAAAAMPGPALLHTAIGSNRQPLTKCDGFQAWIDGGALAPVDAAVLKFCYIDIDADTDAAALCHHYVATLRDLANRHPSTVIVASTVALRHVQAGLGATMREWLGRRNHAALANLRRQEFNDRLRQAWPASRLFDLAAVEATDEAGRLSTTVYRGRTAENLVAAYTDDGGHLNPAGRQAVAAAFLQTLVAATASR